MIDPRGEMLPIYIFFWKLPTLLWRAWDNKSDRGFYKL